VGIEINIYKFAVNLGSDYKKCLDSFTIFSAHSLFVVASDEKEILHFSDVEVVAQLQYLMSLCIDARAWCGFAHS